MFLWNLSNFNELKKNCLQLENLFSENGDKNINGLDLFQEIQYIIQFDLANSDLNPRKLLEFICDKNFKNCLPNLFIILRIILTMPVSVASAERSFSKLKLIKNHLRTTMTQNNFDGLSIILIERDLIMKELDTIQMI